MIIEALLIAWFIIHFEPLQRLLGRNDIKILTKIFTCFKCTAFWVTIIYCIIIFNFTIYPAIINAVIGYIYSRIDNQFPTKL